jgi:ribosomal protein S18 acetylase RimI-like enzyme
VTSEIDPRPYDVAMLELVDKSPDDIVHWVPAMFASYVEERVGAGESRESAWGAASTQQEQLFPGGVPAKGQHVMNLVLDGQAVGVLWIGRPLGASADTWFVFYVEVDEAHRGQGLGKDAMLAAERWATEHGGSRIALNVFGPNTVARSLYDSLGYQVLATGMYKDL